MLEKVARWTFTHRKRTLVVWIVAFLGFAVLGGKAGGEYQRNFSLPGAESQQALDLLRSTFPARAGGSLDIVMKFSRPPSAADVAAVESALRLDGVAGVDSVTAPSLCTPGRCPRNSDPHVSRTVRIAYAEVRFDKQAFDVSKSTFERVRARVDRLESRGIDVEYGGDVAIATQQQKPGGTEAVGLLAALLILLITFGSLLAAGLPLLTAILGIGIGLGLLLLSAHVVSVPEFAPQVSAMIGIGVGIDYALFILTRYRQGLHEGLDPEAATVRAMTTAGRAVIFAGTIVVISLLGILLMGFQFAQGVAVGGAASVFVTMLASVTLLPAMLGFAGRNIEKLHIPFFHRDETRARTGFWFRWSRLIQRTPWTAGLAGLALIVLLAVPLFSMRLGSADAGNDPATLTTRRAYDLLSEGFGPGFNGPLLLAAQVRGTKDLDTLRRLDERLQRVADVAFVSPVVPNNAGTAAIITVVPRTAPQDAATSVLVKELRRSVIPSITNGTGVRVFVGGLVATFVDFAAKIADRLPILILVVIALSFMLLMAVFRSVLVPIKAAIMNLLSIGAAYGVVVAVFQWGWLRQIIGVDRTGPIESWVPMMMFTILFGLSMDYEIFLLSRVREEYLRSRDNARSVADGVASTGRVITAAAAIMIAVFLTFVIGFDIRQIKEIGLGLAVAVFVDATLVRMILVPATMELLGDANWWLPRWLDRSIPSFAIEQEHELERV
ncbi:MAG: MMPL family transporter [Actinomycetota bacterium]